MSGRECRLFVVTNICCYVVCSVSWSFIVCMITWFVSFALVAICASLEVIEVAMWTNPIVSVISVIVATLEFTTVMLSVVEQIMVP